MLAPLQQRIQSNRSDQNRIYTLWHNEEMMKGQECGFTVESTKSRSSIAHLRARRVMKGDNSVRCKIMAI